MSTKTIRGVLFTTSIQLFLLTSVYSQIGLWEVKSVKVGANNRTPVAKWFRFNDNKTFQSGNGWTQNSAGNWTVDESKEQLTLDEQIALSEGNAPFSIKLNNNNMTWERTEFGEKVIVQLEKISEIPRTPTDEVQGLWAFANVIEDGKDITASYDPDSKRMIFIRPDRRFQDEYGPGGLIRGYWHMNMHHPLFTLIYEDRNQSNEVWEVQFKENDMKWSGKSETNKNLSLNFRRLKRFPGN